jgi:acetyl/propionyl-CoA carboxylase alpha subunit
MISKLSTWGEDRHQALARMRRALSEYEVRGIKTTIPFFQWMLATEDFVQGRFDTTTLDELLARRTTPFVETPEVTEQIATVATAIRAFLAASRSDGSARARSVSPWLLAARRDGLRP